MRVITEAVLRDELHNSRPELYYIPKGAILSPAGKEYLQQLKIKISYEERPKASGNSEKPEHMTHLYENRMVNKDHPRILFRGKLDSLQAMIILVQCEITETGSGKKLVELLQSILDILRMIMRCDVKQEPFQNEYIIGLNHTQLREHSHNPMKFYKVKQMLMPDHSYGKVYAMLNQVRTAVRETELAAVLAFKEDSGYTREDIIKELNRLSSAVHILMCMYLAGELGE